MNQKTNGSKEQPLQCETSVCCKATAALGKEIAEELEQEDQNLQELLDDNNKTSPICDKPS